MESVMIAMGLTVFAGLSTGIGSAIAFMAKRTDYRFLSVATGFSGGVMLYVSFVEILFKGAESISEIYGEYLGQWINVASFFGGMLVIGIIDTLIPAAENPHETHPEFETMPLHDVTAPMQDSLKTASITEGTAEGGHRHDHHRKKLMRMGLFTALIIGIHNLPEGLATFLAALKDPSLGVAVAVAVAFHNIPEGISVSVPIFYATGNRKKAFFYSLLSGLAEPVGAGIAFAVIHFVAGGNATSVPPHLMGMLFSGIAGVMVYISLDELLPASRAYGKGHDSLFGLIAGMMAMALSLLIMK